MTHRIILIGGAPTVGKTYLAKKLGKEFKIPWISTDTIRDQLRETVENKGDFPNLFNFERRELLNMIKYLKESSPEKIVDDTNLENSEVWRGVVEFINEGSLGNSYIIEGMALTPKEVYELSQINKNIKPIFLLEHNTARLRDVIYTRGLWDAAFKYPDTVKEKEYEWVKLFNSWIESECLKYQLPIIEVNLESSNYISSAKELIS